MKKILYYTNHDSTKIIMHPISPIHSYTLTEDVVQIWCIQLPEDNHPVRFEKLQQLKQKRRKILIDVLKRYLCQSPVILETSSGKPYIENHTLQFNLSHSGNLLLIAIHQSQPIGIDIEKIKTRDFVHFSTRFWGDSFVHAHLSPLNVALVPLIFFQAWTQTEAWVKQKGQTIFQFDDFIPQPNQNTFDFDNQKLVTFTPKIGFVACVCMPKSIHQIQIQYQDLTR